MTNKNFEEGERLDLFLEKTNEELKDLAPKERLEWGVRKFGSQFALTTSFGIQSSVLLHMIKSIQINNAEPKIIWVDTGYLPKETYQYAEQLINQFQLEVIVAQSNISPARMEAIEGKLWERNSLKDIERYNLLRKVIPLEDAFSNLKISCWASGVRSNQTDHRRKMHLIDKLKKRITLRPILEWTQKDIFYYMKEHNLPQHPLFMQGYSTVGDWHSSAPDSQKANGRKTRFGGLKQECGIHLSQDTDDQT